MNDIELDFDSQEQKKLERRRATGGSGSTSRIRLNSTSAHFREEEEEEKIFQLLQTDTMQHVSHTRILNRQEARNTTKATATDGSSSNGKDRKSMINQLPNSIHCSSWKLNSPLYT